MILIGELMNGTYFRNPTFPIDVDNNEKRVEDKTVIINENILNNNIGKKVKVFMNYNDVNSFNGIIEYINNSVIIISNPKSDGWYYLLLNDLKYIEFEEKINI